MASAVVLGYLGYDAWFLAIGGAVAICLVLFLRWRSGDQPERDERTERLRAYSLAYSYLASLILALILFVAHYLRIADLDSLIILQILIYAMTGSAIASMLILGRRGDVGGA